ncbi:MAG: 50S ribosomal protein L18e [Candidatus Pacearchaeota archaeon]
MISQTKLKEKIRRKSNPQKIRIINFLRKQSPFWLKVSEYLAKPKRISIKVNISKIDKVAKPNSIIVVPGKVLSEGELTKPITIAAFSFSEKARQKLKTAKIVSLEELAKENKKGEGIMLLI